MTEAQGVPIIKPPSEQPKPGYKTTEFYLSLLAILMSAAFASGLIPVGGTVEKIAAMAATVLTAAGYKVSRTLVKTAGALLLVMLIASSSMACGASTREKTIRVTLTTTDAARTAFEAFDQPYQQALLNKAPDKPTFDKQLADYRAKQAKILAAFAVVYRAIAAAATVNDQPTFDGMVQAALILSGALRDLGVPL